MCYALSLMTPEEEAPAFDNRSPGADITVIQCASLSVKEPVNRLDVLATELRLMIWVELLVVWPKKVFRGSRAFGVLDKEECDGDIQMPWQIIATCQKYYFEAVPIMYSLNRFAFCTGKAGSPGEFWRFPIKPRYMPLIQDLSIYLRADTPTKEAARRVGHFLRAINRHAINIKQLTVVISSDRHYDARCPWDIVFGDHPVFKALELIVETPTIQHLRIRFHDGALLFPQLALYLNQQFERANHYGRSLTFSQSCTCAVLSANPSETECDVCGCPRADLATKPVELIVPPDWVESGMERMMDMQWDLFVLGILPPVDDDDDELEVDPNHVPFEDESEEIRKGFHAAQPEWGRVQRYRGLRWAPRVWRFRQSLITEYFRFVCGAFYGA